MRLIDADSAIEVVHKWLENVFGISSTADEVTVFKRLRALPTVDAVSVPHGKWATKWEHGQWVTMWEDMPTVDAERQMALAAFEVLDRLSAAHYGKQMFFMQDNGMIYDRYECDYITLETAVSRMAKILMLDEDRIC